MGQADNNFIEIKISGIPDEIDPLVFMLSESVKNEFEALDLNTEDNIKIEYYINDDNQSVISKIEKI